MRILVDMKLHVNGEEVELETPMTLAELLARHRLKPETVVVEYNRLVPSKAEYARISLRAGDRVEIVKFMGGG